MSKRVLWLGHLVTLVLTACASQQPLTQTPVVIPEVAYGQSQELELACRLLMASRCAYAIVATNQLDDKDKTHYWACDSERYVSERRGFAGGEKLINAVLLELTPDAVILAFRGTLPPGDNRPPQEVLKDWGADLEAELVLNDDISGKTHKGFHEAVRDTFRDLLQVLTEWKANGKLQDKKIYVTGHSKGGAMAIIATLLLSKQQFEPNAVYTFAAPRAGDVDFAAAYDAKHFNTWRYENRYDIVPHVPPNADDSAIVAGVFTDAFREGDDQYRSVGNLMYIDWYGRLTANYAGLETERKNRFANDLTRSPASIAEVIINAHSSGRSDGYGQAICQEPPKPPSP